MSESLIGRKVEKLDLVFRLHRGLRSDRTPDGFYTTYFSDVPRATLYLYQESGWIEKTRVTASLEITRCYDNSSEQSHVEFRHGGYMPRVYLYERDDRLLEIIGATSSVHDEKIGFALAFEHPELRERMKVREYVVRAPRSFQPMRKWAWLKRQFRVDI